MIPRLSIPLAAALLSTAATIHADELQLTAGGRLTGEVSGIGEDGKIRMAVEIAKQPIDFRVDQVEKVLFNSGKSGTIDHDTLITLSNGDIIPCELRGIDAARLKVATSYAGDFTIPRKAVSVAQFGIQPRNVLYRGPDNLAGWKVEDNWHFDHDALVSDGRGTIHRQIKDLPRSFSVSFTINWERNPNVQVYLCSSIAETGGTTDRYYLQFNSAGMELKRQSSVDKPYRPIGIINRSPDTFPNRTVNVEIRIDHRQHLILLYLDGVLEDRYPDPLPNPPTGDLILFNSNLSEENGHRISNIEVREWDARTDRHRNEDRGKGDQDALIDHEGQRFGGTLVGTQGEGDSLKVLFKSPHYPDALEVPSRNVSTIFFTDADKAPSEETPLLVGLHGSGLLSASTCVIAGDQITMQHPLLDTLTIDRRAATSLTRRGADNSNAEEE